MNDELTGSVGVAIIKAYGIKACLGMIGSALLYASFPPRRPDGSYDQREFVARLVIAAIFSSLFGDWVIALLSEHASWLHAGRFPAPIYLMVGAPGWWISRAAALWFYRREEQDLEQWIDEIRRKK